ncbi:MAG: hypothetical protein M3457_16670 [Chloroflexota bacterium]|nr:hypothetical protein [Chloroflexota bacterium]
MLPHFDTVVAFIDLERGLNYKRAEREGLVNAAIAARRSAEDRPAAIVKLPLSRHLGTIRPIRWMIRLSRSSS